MLLKDMTFQDPKRFYVVIKRFDIFNRTDPFFKTQ